MQGRVPCINITVFPGRRTYIPSPETASQPEPAPHKPLNEVTSRRGHREDGQIPPSPPPRPPHGLMWLGRMYGSPTPHKAAPPSTHLIAFWLCTGPVRQKGCGCECSWNRERGRRRLVSAAGAAHQQHPPLAEGLENGLARRGGERRRGKDVRSGPQEGRMVLL
jgi:hypothetical protein